MKYFLKNLKIREGTFAQKVFAQKSVAQKTKFIYLDFSCSEKNFMSNYSCLSVFF